MTGSQRGKFRIALPVAVAVAITVALVVGVVRFAGDGGDLLVVRGKVATEKVGFLDDPEVRGILTERYGLRVEFAAAGSLQIMQGDPGDQDFLWPGSQIVDEARFDPPPNTEEIFYSPIVLYSWAPVAEALVAAGLVEVTDGTYYVIDFPRLVQLIDGGTRWSDIGLPQLPGPVTITTTDPTASNSGNSFAGLLARIYNGGREVDETTVELVIEPLQAFYARLGRLEQSSGDLFLRFVIHGMAAYPLIANYESMLIDPNLEDEEHLNRVRDEIRVLYPRPTVLTSHPLISLTPAGDRLLTALTDEEFQRLAWERHGFRSDMRGVRNDPAVLAVAGVPSTIDSAVLLPGAAVMERIITALRPDTPDPSPSTGSPIALRPSRIAPARPASAEERPPQVPRQSAPSRAGRRRATGRWDGLRYYAL